MSWLTGRARGRRLFTAALDDPTWPGAGGPPPLPDTRADTAVAILRPAADRSPEGALLADLAATIARPDMDEAAKLALIWLRLRADQMGRGSGLDVTGAGCYLAAGRASRLRGGP